MSKVPHPALRLVWLLTLLIALAPRPGHAIGLIRDAGMEHALQQLARPILNAASLPANRTRILIVDDMSLNAFVIDSRAVFINSGLLLRMRTPEQLQAVIAHELAHIANGHFARRRINAQNARTNSALGLALGLAAGLATGSAEAGVGVALGTASTAQRNFFGHTREEEAAADKSGMRYLARAGIPPVAMRDLLTIFAGQEALSPSRQDPYARSHPLTSERLRAVDLTAETLKPRPKEEGDEVYWFRRAKEKLSAYLRSPSYTFSRIKASDTSDPARIARVLGYYKTPDMTAARREMNLLLETHPEDPYLHELSGFIELETGHVQRAIDAYQTASELAPREPLILAGYGRALLAQNTKTSNAEALEVLESARARDRYDPRLQRDLAVAYARDGQNGMASLATAERYALFGQYEDAALHAHRAVGALPVGSPSWARAQDVIRAAESKKRR